MDLPSTLVIGDDYLAANSRDITWSVTPITGLLLADLTCKFGISNGTDSIVISGTVSMPAATWVASVDVPRTALVDMPEGLYLYSVEIVSTSGTEITIAKNEPGQFLRLRAKQT